MNRPLNENNQSPLFISKIISATMMAAVVIYAVVMFMLREEAPIGQEVDVVVKYVLALIGLGAIPAAFFIKSVRLDKENLRESLDLNRVAEDGSVNPEVLHKLSQTFLTVQILSIALIESTAIMGMVIYFLSGDPVFGYGMVGVSFVMMILNFPRESAFNDLVRDVARQSGSGM